MGEIVNRPWGTYEVLYDGNDCKVKKITVNPGQRLSLQSHKQREEIWTIVSGVGYVEVSMRGEYDHKGYVFEKDVVDIEKYAKHRIKNPTGEEPLPKAEPLVFIEVQLGSYFGEDDITRYEDDYGRVEDVKTV